MAILPENPSVTMTSTKPFAISFASMKPLYLKAPQHSPRNKRADSCKTSFPFISSVPTLSNPIDGQLIPATERAKKLPKIESCTICDTVDPIVAPTSNIMHFPLTVGQNAARDGRSTPLILLKHNLAIAIRAPVLPAVTTEAA
ncbi:hypothetical protein FXW31_05000 [Candidatus Liberibacter asiaticus]|nr:hypothetical protein FXW31_05000 [Candidatus Liberibacter asiaticus]